MEIGFGAVISLVLIRCSFASLFDVVQTALLSTLTRMSGGCCYITGMYTKSSRIIELMIYELPDRQIFLTVFKRDSR